MDKTDTTDPRERIVQTALRLFYQQGYLATGINQVIAESSVAKATFYNHFPSKASLCVAYLKARHRVWTGWLEADLDNLPRGEAKVRGVFDFLARWMEDCDFRGCAFLNIASEIPELNSDIRKEVVAHKDGLRRLLEDIIPGDLDRKREVSDFIYVLVEGAISASQNYGETWPVHRAREAAMALLRQ